MISALGRLKQEVEAIWIHSKAPPGMDRREIETETGQCRSDARRVIVWHF